MSWDVQILHDSLMAMSNCICLLNKFHKPPSDGRKVVIDSSKRPFSHFYPPTHKTERILSIRYLKMDSVSLSKWFLEFIQSVCLTVCFLDHAFCDEITAGFKMRICTVDEIHSLLIASHIRFVQKFSTKCRVWFVTWTTPTFERDRCVIFKFLF